MPTIPRHALALALCLLLLLGLTPTAAQAASEASKYLTAAVRLYENLEYERALQKLAQAKRLVRAMEEDVTIALYEGLIYADMNKWEEANIAFKEGLYLKPDAQLPAKAAPKVQRAFEAARQEVKAELARAATPQKPSRPEQEPLVAAPPAASPAPVEVEARGSRSRALLPAAVGGGLLIAGGVMWGLAFSERGKLRSTEPQFATRDEVQRSASRGRTYQTVGFTLMGAGVVGLGLAAGLYATGAPAPVAVSATPEGAAVFVSGRWP
jgi:tetratricopeptide (TPR) repeat protein